MDGISRAQECTQRHSDESSKAATDYSLIVPKGSPSQPDARFEVGFYRKAQTLGNPNLRCSQNGCGSNRFRERGVQDVVRLLVRYHNRTVHRGSILNRVVIRKELRAVQKMIPEHRTIFPAHADIDRQSLRDAIVVLGEQRIAIGIAMRIWRDHRVKVRAVWNTQ